MMHALLLPLLLVLPGHTPAKKKPRPPVTSRSKEQPYIAATRAKAKRGNAKAQFDLGICYAFGTGVTQNAVEAVTWYRKAADQGYEKAQYNLGVCYDFGRGVAKDNAEAALWYRKAAEQDHAKAQFNLGVSYKYGQGVPRDPVEAYAWLSLAAAGGETKAIGSRQEVAMELTPQDLERAQAREQKLRGEIQARKSKPKRPRHSVRKRKARP